MITTLARPAYNAIAAAWPGSTLRSSLGGRDASSTDSCRIILRTGGGTGEMHQSIDVHLRGLGEPLLVCA